MAINNQLTEKAWTKIKIGAGILIASCALALLLLPTSYDYSAKMLSLSVEVLIPMYICAALLQIWLIIVGVKFYKKDFAFAALSSLKRRFIYITPIAISFVFVPQLSKFANMIAFILLLFACMNLKKAGVFTSYNK